MDTATTNELRLAELLLKEEFSELLYREADLLDQGEHDEWLELIDDDIEYVMPLRLNVRHDEPERAITRSDEVCWFSEGKTTLTQRVGQLQTGEHWAEEPLSRVSHLVTNVRLLSIDPDPFEPAEVTVGCRFLVYRNRVADETDLWAGRRTDTWVNGESGWRLRRRYLLLDQNVLLAKNLTVLF